MDEVLAAKLVALAVLGVGSLVAGCLPMAALAVVQRRGKETLRITAESPLFSFCLCFGAGVLLSTLLCHMIPESLESWDEMQESGLVAANDVPLPSILIGVGFFMVYLLEEVAHHLMHRTLQRRKRLHVAVVELDQIAPGSTDSAGLSAAQLQHKHAHDTGQQHSHDTGQQHSHSAEQHHSHSAEQHHSHSAEQPHSHGAALASSGGSTFVTLLLLAALSFHAVLEGIAVGAEETKADVYLMLAAVSSHKFILVFILGLEMLTTTLRPAAQLGCVLCFVGATMLGIGIGIGVLELEAEGRAHDVSLMVMQTLASGTLMYVCFMEVLSRERSRQGHALTRFACTAAGFVLIAVLVSLVTEPEEGDDAAAALTAEHVW